MKRSLTFLVVAFAAVLVMSTTIAAQTISGYHVAKTLEIGGDGGWDYVNFDPSSNRLYIARATRVMVVDVESGKLVGELPGTNGVHGVALVSKLGRGVTSNGKDNRSE